jgi:Endonuclease NucS
MNYWKVFCMKNSYPGLWQRWFKNQCVAVGWCAKWGYTLRGKSKGEKGGEKGWSEAKNALNKINNGDWILVQLAHNRVGRIGEVVRKQVGDNQWAPLVPPSREEPDGEMGRRILVRWDLTVGPSDAEMVVTLPPPSRLPMKVVRPTIRQLDPATFQLVRQAMKSEANWVSLLSQFEYERSHSDYIGTYPHRLEDGLQPYPSVKVREKVFSDRSRSDVLLIDQREKPVVVECKQGAPTLDHIGQLRHYMQQIQKETGKKTRGILVHGGARKLMEEVRQEIETDPQIEIVQYSLRVDFVACK